jgi:hypothetical protein
LNRVQATAVLKRRIAPRFKQFLYIAISLKQQKMALEEFEKQESNRRQKGYAGMRSIMDYGMGLLIAAMGVFFIFSNKISRDFPQFDDPWIKGLGVVAVIYGIFRIYRGYKKIY